MALSAILSSRAARLAPDIGQTRQPGRPRAPTPSKVFLLEQAAWKNYLVNCCVFPAGKYDDGVDVCSLIGRGIEMMPAPGIRKYEPVPERAPSAISAITLGWRFKGRLTGAGR
jgi:hypothetical protein